MPSRVISSTYSQVSLVQPLCVQHVTNFLKLIAIKNLCHSSCCIVCVCVCVCCDYDTHLWETLVSRWDHTPKDWSYETGSIAVSIEQQFLNTWWWPNGLKRVMWCDVDKFLEGMSFKNSIERHVAHEVVEPVTFCCSWHWAGCYSAMAWQVLAW
jgi:hypothetical protein